MPAIGPPKNANLAKHMLDEAQRMMEAGRYEGAMLYAEAAMNLLRLVTKKREISGKP